MEVTSSSSAWSHRPAPDLIGVSVFQRQNQLSLRLTRLQTELAQKLEEARTLVQQMERLSGLRLMLDRNLRLVVNLTPLK